jgi:hypothetical protein
MDKNKTNRLRQYVSVALQSAKIYTDMGGDVFGINVLSALFKWPDVVCDLLDVIDGKTNSDNTLIKDISDIMLDPLTALGLAYLDAVDLPQNEKDTYRTILRNRTAIDIGEILKHRDMIVSVLVKLTAMKEKQNANRNSGDVKERGV